MTRIQIQTTLALVAVLALSACAGSKNDVTQGPGDTTTPPPVIGDPNAKGTAGIKNHLQLRGAVYAMLGFSGPVTVVDTFLTTNRQTFNGTGQAQSITVEEMQKRLEFTFVACTNAVSPVGAVTSNLSSMLTGWNLNAGPSQVTPALIGSYASALWKVATGEASMPSDLLASFIQFKTDFATGATDNGTTTKALAASICSAVLASPKAMAVL